MYVGDGAMSGTGVCTRGEIGVGGVLMLSIGSCEVCNRGLGSVERFLFLYFSLGRCSGGGWLGLSTCVGLRPVMCWTCVVGGEGGGVNLPNFMRTSFTFFQSCAFHFPPLRIPPP